MANQKLSDAEMGALYQAAVMEGKKAAAGCTPRPMAVSYKTEAGPRTDIIDDGLCGFAWVNVRPGTSRFAQWLRKNNLAHKDSYYGGVTIWIGDYNQSVARKEAHARAMADVLTKAGIEAQAMSRLD